jgi:hypothetical protein
MLLFLLLTAFGPPPVPQCVLLSCEEDTCVIDTPEGYAPTWRRQGWKAGDRVHCVDVGIEPT